MNINETLHTIQKTLKAPKGQRNSFGNYNYRSCEDIVEAVKPLLPNDYVLLLCDEVVDVGGRVFVKSTASIENKEETAKATGFAEIATSKKGMDVAQITGAASSYARKYALNGLFAIDDTKDNDTDERKNQENEAAKQADKEKADKLMAEKAKAESDAKALIYDLSVCDLAGLGDLKPKGRAIYPLVSTKTQGDISEAIKAADKRLVVATFEKAEGQE